MCKDYTAGNIPHSDIFKPYFEWKKEEHSLLLPSQNRKPLPLCGRHDSYWNIFMIYILTPIKIFLHMSVTILGKNTPDMGKTNIP